MEKLIADITNSIVNDIEWNEEIFSPALMLTYLDRYFINTRTNLNFAEPHCHGHDMIKLVAIKQMIDTLSYAPTVNP